MGRPDRGVAELATIRMRAASPVFLTREGTFENPALTEIFVVNDYIMAWLSAMAVAATLKRRAVEGGQLENPNSPRPALNVVDAHGNL